MIMVLENCFGEKIKTDWKEKLEEMIPSYGKKLAENPELIKQIRDYSKDKLQLEY